MKLVSCTENAISHLSAFAHVIPTPGLLDLLLYLTWVSRFSTKIYSELSLCPSRLHNCAVLPLAFKFSGY